MISRIIHRKPFRMQFSLQLVPCNRVVCEHLFTCSMQPRRHFPKKIQGTETCMFMPYMGVIICVAILTLSIQNYRFSSTINQCLGKKINIKTSCNLLVIPLWKMHIKKNPGFQLSLRGTFGVHALSFDSCRCDACDIVFLEKEENENNRDCGYEHSGIKNPKVIEVQT
ncbi:hypothetical protein SDC9_129788 [bioreactor metagenome]|uniref:Uncharacterized protein n=1 Tax=bioreactor metagenome TaxID=1076179 RepID=A0A645CZY4_9ZZZZ